MGLLYYWDLFFLHCCLVENTSGFVADCILVISNDGDFVGNCKINAGIKLRNDEDALTQIKLDLQHDTVRGRYHRRFESIHEQFFIYSSSYASTFSSLEHSGRSRSSVCL